MRWLFPLWIALAVSGCLRPTEERARRDLEVGKASAGGVKVHVEQGLAAVRRAEAGELELWMSAPAVTARLEVAAGAPKVLKLVVDNALHDLTLTAKGASVTALTPDSKRPKRKVFTLVLGATEVVLTLAPPDVADQSPWSFAVLSDVQEAIDDVGDVYKKLNEVERVRFLLGAGDLTEQGTDDQLNVFREQLETAKVPYYTTLGNHELGASTEAPPYQRHYGRASFHFAYRGVHFSMLDSASATIDPLVYDWLDGWLDDGRDSVHVVAMHIPPLDPIGVRNGAFASRNEAAKLLTRLAKAKVDLTLYGHIHSYYGYENAGIPAYISGGGGAIPERFDDMGRHFLVVDVDPESGIADVDVVRVD